MLPLYPICSIIGVLIEEKYVKNNIDELQATLCIVEDENEHAYLEWKDYCDYVHTLRENMCNEGATADTVRQMKDAEGWVAESFERWCQATEMVELLEHQIEVVKWSE
jgi:hypothetical protein